MLNLYLASRAYVEAYMEAYRAFLHVQTGEEDEERAIEVVRRMSELVAHCMLYLREHPGEQDYIELVIDQLATRRDNEDS